MVSSPLNFTMIMGFHEKIKRKKTDVKEVVKEVIVLVPVLVNADGVEGGGRKQGRGGWGRWTRARRERRDKRIREAFEGIGGSELGMVKVKKMALLIELG
ncbi:hypothetical protein LOK49_LG08G01593 [Camellia lanceoleosa]|uniref:Uncharacterized protein n=1 Tax=Camellia lanceoleosa TaxID=1840588 RepID=A0ACC0GR67_9ERIC|nr:hypothetical protein LOK49_LG08G01593 [Camellia lanceoleosa]